MCASFRFERTRRSCLAKSKSLNRSRCGCACFFDPFLAKSISLKRSRGGFAGCFDPQGSISGPRALPGLLPGRVGSSRPSRESSPRTGRRVRTGGRVRIAPPGAGPRVHPGPLEASAPAPPAPHPTISQGPFPPSVSLRPPHTPDPGGSADSKVCGLCRRTRKGIGPHLS